MIMRQSALFLILCALFISTGFRRSADASPTKRGKSGLKLDLELSQPKAADHNRPHLRISLTNTGKTPLLIVPPQMEMSLWLVAKSPNGRLVSIHKGPREPPDFGALSFKKLPAGKTSVVDIGWSSHLRELSSEEAKTLPFRAIYSIEVSEQTRRKAVQIHGAQIAPTPVRSNWERIRPSAPAGH
jgi:hypothetical protein